jgi:hypothetical protein
MIIVSQNKKFIVNFNNIYSIGLDKKNEAYYVNCTFNNADGTLGIYKTEERAKEVLQEIIDLIGEDDFYHIKKSQLNNLDELAEPKYIIKPVMKPKVYKMPLE